jgi:hypothetical protein
MTCHAMARVNASGDIYKGADCICDSECDGCTLLGAPIAASFVDMKQLDFVWSFLEIPGKVAMKPGCRTRTRSCAY